MVYFSRLGGCGVGDGLGEGISGLAEVVVLGLPLRRDRPQQRLEAGPPVAVLGREVGAAVEGLSEKETKINSKP